MHPTIRRPLWSVLALAHAALIAAPSRAWAHGSERWPNVTALTAPAHGPERPWLAALTFGAMLSDDGGRRFDWICEEALLGRTDGDNWVGAFDRDHLLYAGAGLGVAASHDGGCAWQPLKLFAPPFFVFDVGIQSEQAKNEPPAHSAYVLGTKPGSRSSLLFASRDHAKSFARVPLGAAEASAPSKAPRVSPIYWTALATSPSRPGWLWLAGSNNRAGDSAFVATLREDGSQWSQWPVPAAPAVSGTAKLAVHPTDANVVVAAFLDVTSNGTQVLLSEDGGRSSHKVALVREPVRSIAFAADGALWLGGTTRTFVAPSYQQPFVELRAPSHNACVAAIGHATFLCGDAAAGDGFSLARVEAGAKTLVPHFSLPRLTGPYRCPAESPVAKICRPLWAAQAQRLGARFAAPKVEGPR